MTLTIKQLKAISETWETPIVFEQVNGKPQPVIK